MSLGILFIQKGVLELGHQAKKIILSSFMQTLFPPIQKLHHIHSVTFPAPVIPPMAHSILRTLKEDLCGHLKVPSYILSSGNCGLGCDSETGLGVSFTEGTLPTYQVGFLSIHSPIANETTKIWNKQTTWESR